MDERHVNIPNSPKRINFVQNNTDAESAVSHLLQFDMLGYDCETWHTVSRNKGAFDPTEGARMRLVQFGTPEGVAFVFDLFRVSKSFLYKMFPNNYLLVGQNLKFEFKFLQYELGIYDFRNTWDTMIAEQIISQGAVAPNAPGYVPVGLDKISQRRLGVALPKDEQASDWWMPELSHSQVEYAARDAIVVLPIYQVQRELINQQSQVRVLELEFDTTPAIADMENNGMRLDGERWLEVCDENLKDLDLVKTELWEMLGQQQNLFEDSGVASLNLNSKPQVQAAFKRIGVDLPLDKDKKVTLSARLLKDMESHAAIAAYMKYVKYDKARSSYGPDWLAKINPFDNRIHCSIMQIGAETGRLAAKHPNMMQIKKDDRYRSCFIAEPGWVFIDADYSQCELRILAEYCRDKNLLHAFDNDYDLHRYSASLIYKCLMEAVTAIQRGIAKNLNFGIVYGIGVAKFALDAGLTHAEAEVIMSYYLKQAYPNMGQWLETRARSVLSSMQATTMTGRVRKYVGDFKDKEWRAGVQRNAKNMPIQGTNADITKRAMALLYKRTRGNSKVKPVMVIHDEILIESRPDVADQSSWDLQDCMLIAEGEYLKRVKSKVDVSMTLEWSKEPSPKQLEAAQEFIRSY